MMIYKEDLEGSYNFVLDDEFDFSKVKVEDALVDKINLCKIHLDVKFLNDEDFIFNIHIDSDVDYLDANTLDRIKLNIDVDEEVPFSFNKDTADELDIDFFGEEINFKDLIFELIILNIPFNYSENKNAQVLTEEQFEQGDQNKPFAQIFKDQGEE